MRPAQVHLPGRRARPDLSVTRIKRALAAPKAIEAQERARLGENRLALQVRQRRMLCVGAVLTNRSTQDLLASRTVRGVDRKIAIRATHFSPSAACKRGGCRRVRRCVVIKEQTSALIGHDIQDLSWLTVRAVRIVRVIAGVGDAASEGKRLIAMACAMLTKLESVQSAGPTQWPPTTG